MTRRALICTAGPGTSASMPGGVDPLLLSDRAPADDPDTAALLGRVAAAHAAGAEALVFWDGDLLGRPDALEVLRAATQHADAEVFTAGGLLARRDALEALQQAGLRRVTVPLCGPDAAAHDYVTGEEGSFQRAIRGLRAARAAGIATRLLLPVLRPTHRSLDELVRRSLAIGVGGFVFMLPRGPDRAAQPLLPTHAGLVAGSVIRGLEVARKARRPAVTLGFDPALLGAFSRAVWPATSDMRVVGMADAHKSSATPSDTDFAALGGSFLSLFKTPA